MTAKAAPFQFFASCPKNLESLLEQELLNLGAMTTKQTVAGVHFEGTLATAYSACLWSRFANRILLPLSRFNANDANALYEGTKKIDWSEHLLPSSTLVVDFNGSSTAIHHTQFGAQKVKDAIVDQLREKSGQRPCVQKENPDLRVNAHLQNNVVTISIDLSGESLHRRGYRTQGGLAPLKENVASAILYRANWPHIAAQQGTLIDPMCGSGTLLTEAFMIAADIAPGFYRKSYGFQKWLQHPSALWRELWQDAVHRREEGLKRELPAIMGFDSDPRAIACAHENIKNAGLSAYISVETRELKKLSKQLYQDKPKGLIITNPPYGERLSDEEQLIPVYRELGHRLKSDFFGWTCAILTASPALGKNLSIRAYKYYSFFNGKIPCRLLLFSIEQKWFISYSS